MESVYVNMRTGEETKCYEIARLWHMSGCQVSVCVEGRFQISVWDHKKNENSRQNLPEIVALLAGV